MVDFDLLIKQVNTFTATYRKNSSCPHVCNGGDLILNSCHLLLTRGCLCHSNTVSVKVMMCRCNDSLLTDQNKVICYLIKQKNIRVHQKSTCNGHTLFLTSRQLYTTFTNLGFISFLSFQAIK